MKFSEQWLREWVNPEITTQELVDHLTLAGLEVDGEEAVAGEFTGIVVGQVVSREQHPDADKLSLCQVTDGTENFQIVCGAANVREGLKIPFAKIGAVLPTDDGKGFKETNNAVSVNVLGFIKSFYNFPVAGQQLN